MRILSEAVQLPSDGQIPGSFIQGKIIARIFYQLVGHLTAAICSYGFDDHDERSHLVILSDDSMQWSKEGWSRSKVLGSWTTFLAGICGGGERGEAEEHRQDQHRQHHQHLPERRVELRKVSLFLSVFLILEKLTLRFFVNNRYWYNSFSNNLQSVQLSVYNLPYGYANFISKIRKQKNKQWNDIFGLLLYWTENLSNCHSSTKKSLENSIEWRCEQRSKTGLWFSSWNINIFCSEERYLRAEIIREKQQEEEEARSRREAKYKRRLESCRMRLGGWHNSKNLLDTLIFSTPCC